MNISKLQAELQPGEGYIFVSPENRRYLTGFESSDGFLLVTHDESVFLTDSRYIEAARNIASGCSEIMLMKRFSEDVPAAAAKLGIKKLYTEAEKLTVAQFRDICGAFACECEAEKADEAAQTLRRCKGEAEKKLILEAQSIAERAFDHILGFIREGVTEKEISLELDYFMLRNGAEALSFETIAVSGANSSMPHGVPGEKKIEKGDFITMDYGAVVNGYHSDMTRTVAVGGVSDKQAKIYETVLSAQLAALDAFAPGVPCAQADAAARSIIAEAGFGDNFGHGTGHGVGIEIHEAPSVSPRSKETLEIGDVVTSEPGIYIPGEFGVRIEDMAIITAEGCENLTKAPKSLIIL